MIHRISSIFSRKTSAVKSGTIWTLAGFGAGIVLRMISSLILTRIFLPDIFGLMAIVSAIIAGMEMLSEVGVRNSLIQNPNAKNIVFAQTAWTVQIIRGLILWLIVCLFSETLAEYFQEPLLNHLLPVSGLILIIKGFTSANQALYSRELGVKNIILTRAFVQIISVLFIVTFSFVYQSIWVIIAGSIISSLLDTILSFILYKHFTMRFKLDKVVLKSLFKLGKWLFIATTLHFLISQGDRLILGGVINKTELGLYNLAAMFTQIPISILGSLAASILIPFLANTFNEKPEQFNELFNQLLQRILNYMMPLVAALAIFGNIFIQLLYPKEFHPAGQILQLLAIASFFQVISFALIPVFLSRGDSFRHMFAYLSLAFLFLPGIYFGFEINGMWGAFYGMFIAQVLWMPIIIYLTRKYVYVDFWWIFKILLLYLFLTVFIVLIISSPLQQFFKGL
jgi:O-antigen/teichoic acid export membrane protein